MDRFVVVKTLDDALLVRFYKEHWIDMGVQEKDIADDWRVKALSFVQQARSEKYSQL